MGWHTWEQRSASSNACIRRHIRVCGQCIGSGGNCVAEIAQAMSADQDTCPRNTRTVTAHEVAAGTNVIDLGEIVLRGEDGF